MPFRQRAAAFLLLSTWARCWAAEDESPAPAVATYLSEDYFPGLFVLEPGADARGARRLRAYPGGQLPASSGQPPISVDASLWGDDLVRAREDIQIRLGLLPPEPLQNPWGLFDAQGRRIERLPLLWAAPVAFLLEIGVWVWPAVRIGFEQLAEGVGAGGGTAMLRTLSLRPKVFEVRNFLTQNETEEVMALGAKQGLHTSQGVMQSADLQKGTKHSQFRTSTQAWLDNSLSPLVAELDSRIAELTRVPADHNEPVQLLRYGAGQYYHGHMDWTELELYPDQRDIWVGSHFGHQDRLATVFWYLNDVAVGGETIFPKHGQPICDPKGRGGKSSRNCPGAPDPEMASCQKGLKVSPRRGTVVLWYNYHANGRGDRNALHAGCPVGDGLIKWSANKWVRTKPIRLAEDQARWIDGHPALERHGWLGGGTVRKNPDDCSVAFTSKASVPAEILWQASSGELHRMMDIPPGERRDMKSFRGHKFVLRDETGRTTSPSECVPPRSDFVLTAEFTLLRAGAGGREDL